MIRTGLDRLLADPTRLGGRRYALLTHLAAVSERMVPAHLALAGSPVPPARLLSPEHGLYGSAQDMESTEDSRDPWTGLPIVSLYGAEESSLRPDPACFDGLDLLLIDLQDVGCRYYTYAATAVWAATAALGSGCEVWVLDRPNPLGGSEVEGNLRRPGFESFVGAFELPVRHGLTLGELVKRELAGSGAADEVIVWEVEGWQREMSWSAVGRPWVAPSPNMPSADTAAVYPGLCLVEATTVSEGRGTTRPFQLVGAPGLDAPALARDLSDRGLDGVRFAPTRFRPEFQKHAGQECDGIEIVISDRARLRPFRVGVELVLALARQPGFGWRHEPYEFVSDRPAIDLLTGDRKLRDAVECGEEPSAWIDSWTEDEAAFRELRRSHLIYA